MSTEPPRSAGKKPDLSVLMASFNTARFIERSIESVLSIEGIDVELVIQDGGSTDETEAIITRLSDPRIRFVSEPDHGQSDAWNRALARATSDWIGWLNADDLYDAAGVEGLAGHLGERLDFLYGDYGTIDEDGRKLKHYRSSRPFTREGLLRYGVYVNCSAAFYRAEMLRAVGGLDRDLHYCMDYDLLFRLQRQGVRSLYVPGPVQYLRTHSDAKSQNVWQIAREGAKVGFRNARGVRGGRIRVLTSLTIFSLYLLSAPIWNTNAWRRIRPEKRL
ncbi:MAG: glycosyltransferase family 2 protein [Solirubrobacteraceae bacterium]